MSQTPPHEATTRTCDCDAPLKDRAAQRLAAMMAPFERSIARAGWLTVIASLLWVPMAGAISVAIGGLAAGTATTQGLFGAALVFLAIGALRVWLNWVATGWLDGAANQAIARERAALITGQDRLSPRAERLASASVGVLLVDKLAQFAPFISRYRPAALRVAVVPVVLLLAALSLSWAAALVLVVAGPLIPVFMALVGLAAREASERQMAELGSLTGMLAERISALTDIRLLNAQAAMLSEFAERSDRLRDRTMAVLRVAFLSSAVLELFSALGVAMVAVYVGFSLLGEVQFGTWASALTPAQGVFLLMIAPEFFQPLRDLATAWHDKAGALAVAEELADLKSAEAHRILGSGGAGAIEHTAPTITLTGLTIGAISYPDMCIEPGESLAITGPSGSGKTTLISLIGGLQAPETGSIKFNDTLLSHASADKWRGFVAWLPQATEFPSGPLRDTLLLGAPADSCDADIEAALALASAVDIVKRLPEGLNTALGETGGGVSGGEARRLLLARAALSGRPVLLADEPTADLDAETAAEVISALGRIAASGTTLIVATHDQALISVMQRQIQLKQIAEPST